MRRFFPVFIFSIITLGCLSAPKIPTPEPYGKRYVTRGRDLVKGLAACGYCHGASSDPDSPLSGGRVFYDKYGEVRAANITPSQSGIGDWTAEEISRAIRFSLGRDEEYLSLDLHQHYRWMSDEDIYAVIAYLRTLEPVRNVVKKRDVSFVDRYTTGILEKQRTVAGYVPSLEPSEPISYGGYLVDHVAGCARCHNSPSSLLEEEKYLDGGQEIKIVGEDPRSAPNITGSKVFGIGSWSENDIVSYLKTGRAPGNRISDERFCPTNFYSKGFGQDLFAVAKYLKSLE